MMSMQCTYNEIMKIRIDRLKGEKPLPLTRQIEIAGKNLAVDSSQEANWNFISLLQQATVEHMKLYVPVESSQCTDLDILDPLDPEIYLLPERDLYRKVELERGGQAYCAFLEPLPSDYGPAAEYEAVCCEELFRTVFDDEDCVGLILEPWDLSALLTHELLALILNEDGESASCSLYINYGETPDQDADVLVNAAPDPFDRSDPAVAPFFEKAALKLLDLLEHHPPIAQGEMYVTPSQIGSSTSLFHVALSQNASREEISSMLDMVLEKALSMGFTSIAIPAEICVSGSGDIPFMILTISKWLYDHPDCGMSVTITSRTRNIYDSFCDVLFDDGAQSTTTAELMAQNLTNAALEESETPVPEDSTETQGPNHPAPPDDAIESPQGGNENSVKRQKDKN